jgi:pimeloyl-ACP methyl ester carboxylesterase
MGSSPVAPNGTSALPRPVAAASIAGGASLAFLVVRDGSPFWQVVRLVAAVAAAVAVRLALTRRWATPLCFLAGVVGVAAGAGIGGPHLAKAGLHPATVAGLVLLGAGLVVAGWTGWQLLRPRPWWARVPMVPALLVVVFVALWTVGQAVLATNVPPIELGDRTPADVGLDYVDATFTTSDGVELRGWFVPSTNGAAVALLHGAGSTRANELDHAAVLAEAGYGVLLYDARGHGESSGRAMDFGWYGDEDVAAAVSFLAEQPDVDAGRIGVVGMSMGGEQAIGAAGSDDRVGAVVAEGATVRVAGDKAWQSEEYGFLGTVQEGIDWLTFALTDLLTEAGPPPTLRSAVADAAPRPVLLIAAGEVPEEAHAGRFIRAGAPASVELWIVPGADHTGGLDTAPDEWRDRVIGFLDTALAP